MIELQRARLLAAAAGQGAPAALGTGPGSGLNGGLSSRGYVHGSGTSGAVMPLAAGLLGTNSSGSAYASAMTPQQAALHAMRQEDTSIQHFLQRLGHAGSSSSTVPPALSRRMLHRQGVQYRDPAIACIVSGAADRFLSTVLQQATACRDQRLKGVQLAKDAARHRKRHKEQYELDIQERKRRRQDQLKKREDGYLATIEAASGAMPKPPPSSSGAGNDKSDAPAKKPSKKKAAAAADAASASAGVNGKKRAASEDEDEVDEDMYDSLDEEEEYYQNYYGDDSHHSDEDSDEEEENDMLILRDLSRPLEGWGFDVTGKEGMDPDLQQDADDEVGWDGDDENDMELDESAGDTSEGARIHNSESGETPASASAPASPEKKAADSGGKSQATKTSGSSSPIPAQTAASSSNHRSSNAAPT
jgi:Transcription initiation factor TFIID 23-30kDa subunit